jgi:hypothetical protein
MSSKNVIDLRKGAVKPAAVQQQTIRFMPEPEAPRLRASRAARVSPVRARRRKARYILLGIVVFLIALAVYGVSWVSYLPRYNVDTVTIVGTDQVPSADVYDYVESLLHTGGHPFLSRDNIFLYNPKVIQQAIVGNFPRIASASVSRSSLFATDITVTVTERQPYALWCTDDTHTDCYQMDSTGFIFAQASPSTPGSETGDNSSDSSSTDSTNMPQATSGADLDQSASGSSQPLPYIFEGGLGFATSSASNTSVQTTATSTDISQVASTSPSAAAPSPVDSVNPADPIGETFVGAHMPGIVALLQMLGRAGFNPTGAIVENDQDFWVPLSADQSGDGQGFYIKASFGENPGSIVSNLQLVLSSDALNGNESELQYVDLRFGDRVYYKLQGANEAQTSH